MEFQVSYHLKSQKVQAKLALENLRTLDLNALMHYRPWSTRRQGRTPGFFWASSQRVGEFIALSLVERLRRHLPAAMLEASAGRRKP
jgi:hypothetical protein